MHFTCMSSHALAATELCHRSAGPRRGLARRLPTQQCDRTAGAGGRHHAEPAAAAAPPAEELPRSRSPHLYRAAPLSIDHVHTLRDARLVSLELSEEPPDLRQNFRQVRKAPSWPRSQGPTSTALSSCIPTPPGMHGPTCIFWASGPTEPKYALLAAGPEEADGVQALRVGGLG